MGVVANLVVRISAATTDFEKKISGMERQWSRTGAKMEGVGRDLTAAITLPLAGLGVAAVRSGLDFERAMNQINGVLKPTASQMDALRQMSLKMGADTIFSATDAANAMLELGKAGFSVDESLSAVDEVLQLAAASGLSMAEAASMSSRTLNAFGLEVSDLAHVNDVLAEAVLATSLEITDLQTAFQYVGPIAQGFGMSLEEVSAALGLMRDNGIAAETTGRALREGMERLANPVKAVKDVMAEMGIASFKDSNGNLIGLSDIIGILESKGLTAAQSLKMFGDAAGPGMFALVTQGKAALDGLTTQLEQSDGSAKRMADAMMQGLPGAFEALKGSVDTALISISKALEPALIPILHILANMADLVTNVLVPAFTALPVPVQSFLVVLLGVAAAAGPVLFVLGSLVSASGSVVTGFKLVTSAFGSVTSFLTTMFPALTRVAAVFTNWQAVIGAVARAMTALSGPWGWAIGAAVTLGVVLWNVAGGWDGIKAAIAPVVSFLRDVGTIALWVAKEAFLYLWEQIKGVASALWSFATDIVGAVLGGLQSLGSALMDWGASALDAILYPWKFALGWILENFGPEIDTALMVVEAALNTAHGWWDAFIQGAKEAIEWVRTTAALLRSVEDSMQQAGAKSAEMAAKLVPSSQLGVERTSAQLVDDYLSGKADPFAGTAMARKKAPGVRLPGSGGDDELTKLRQQYDGSKAIHDANQLASALRGIDVSKFGQDEQARIFETVHEGIEAYKRLGKEAPASLTALADSTARAATMAGKFGSALDTSALADYGKELERQIENENNFSAALTRAGVGLGSALDTASLQDYRTELQLAEENQRNFSAALDEFYGREQERRLQSLESLAGGLVNLGSTIGGAAGVATAGVGDLIGSFVSFQRNGAPQGALNKMAAIADGAAAVWANTTAGGSAGMNALSGAAQGAAAGMAFGPYGAAVGAGVGALVGFVKSRMVSQEEKDARKEHLAFQNQIISRLYETADATTIAAVAGDRWHAMNVSVADTYLSIGRSVQEADADLRRLHDASRISAEAVQAAAAVIAAAFDEAAADQQRLNDAIDRYGFKWEELGAKFQQTTITNQAKELIEDWRVLVASGIEMTTVNEHMAGAMNQFLQAALAVGAEVPLAMQPILKSFADQGLLVDAAGNKITDLGAAGITWSETMSAGFDRVIQKLDQLIDSLVAAGTAIDPLSGGMVDASNKSLGLGNYAPGTFSEWKDYLASQGVTGWSAINSALLHSSAGDPIPSFANEGIVSQPTLAIVGDAPEPEMVLRRSTVAAIAAEGGGGGGVEVHFHGPVFSSPSEIRAQIADWYHDAVENNGKARGKARRLGLVPA